jgi:hypothetical protein
MRWLLIKKLNQRQTGIFAILCSSVVSILTVMLDRRGKIRFMTGPAASSDAQLRRAQAQAQDSSVAVVIAKELISKKLEGFSGPVKPDQAT